jgi:hypothetical protein
MKGKMPVVVWASTRKFFNRFLPPSTIIVSTCKQNFKRQITNRPFGDHFFAVQIQTILTFGTGFPS